MRRLSPSRLAHRLAAASVAALALAACADPSGPAPDGAPVLAKGGGSSGGGTTTGVSVTAASPAYGRQGATSYPVTITGSGFDAASTVTWERGGVADSRIVVRSRTVVSSTRIDATIDIAADAELSFYDVAVLSGKGSKGVGTEKFEVTTAISIGTLGTGNTSAQAANDLADGWSIAGWGYTSAGQRAFVWRPGQMVDLGAGISEGIDDAGVTVVGSGDRAGFVAAWNGSAWTRTALPIGPSGVSSRAWAVASGPDGVANLIGGEEGIVAKSYKNGLSQPRLWRRIGSAWVIAPLALPPTGTSGAVRTVNARGQAAGNAVTSGGDRSVFWDSTGVMHLLPGTGTIALEMNGDGTLIVGVAVDAAAYWSASVASGGVRTWSGPHLLPGNCARAIGVDDHGNIAGSRCDQGSSRVAPAVWSPPYTTARYLSGLGGVEGGAAWGMSRQGTRVVGGAALDRVTVGVMWENLFTP